MLETDRRTNNKFVPIIQHIETVNKLLYKLYAMLYNQVVTFEVNLPSSSEYYKFSKLFTEFNDKINLKLISENKGNPEPIQISSLFNLIAFTSDREGLDATKFLISVGVDHKYEDLIFGYRETALELLTKVVTYVSSVNRNFRATLEDAAGNTTDVTAEFKQLDRLTSERLPNLCEIGALDLLHIVRCTGADEPKSTAKAVHTTEPATVDVTLTDSHRAIIEELRKGPATSTQLCQIFTHSSSLTRELLRNLYQFGKIDRAGRAQKTFYFLPEMKDSDVVKNFKPLPILPCERFTFPEILEACLSELELNMSDVVREAVDEKYGDFRQLQMVGEKHTKERLTQLTVQLTMVLDNWKTTLDKPLYRRYSMLVTRLLLAWPDAKLLTIVDAIVCNPRTTIVALSEMLSKVGMPTTAKRLHALCRFLEKLHVIKIEKATKTLFLSGLGENEFIWADTTAMTSPQVSEICEFDCCDLYKQLRADPEFLTDRVVREKYTTKKQYNYSASYGLTALMLYGFLIRKTPTYSHPGEYTLTPVVVNAQEDK